VAEATTVCSTFWGCIYSFQTLIGGMLAVLAAAGTAWTVWRSASLPVRARARAQHEKESTERRRQHECVLLSSDLKV
jgi:hypothetical protein